MRHDESDKEDEMARLKLFRSVLGAIALLALCAASSQAQQIVMYDATLGFGFVEVRLVGHASLCHGEILFCGFDHPQNSGGRQADSPVNCRISGSNSPSASTV